MRWAGKGIEAGQRQQGIEPARQYFMGESGQASPLGKLKVAETSPGGNVWRLEDGDSGLGAKGWDEVSPGACFAVTLKLAE